MAYVESWHVRSRSRECAVTHRAFADGETIVTALYPDPESSGYVRRDFSLEAWGQLAAEVEPAFSFWKTSFSAPASDADKVEEKLSPEEILRRLVDEDEDHTENTRYILAVMLERRKLLRETDQQRTTNGILRVYEHRKTGEVFLIRDPDIPLSKIEAMQGEVMVLLENNGRVPTPAKLPEESPGDVAPGEEAPGDEAPGDEAPGDEAPGDEAPGDEAPGDEAPGEEAPGDEVPGDEAPGDEAPGDEAPGDEAPGDEAHADADSETPSENIAP